MIKSLLALSAAACLVVAPAVAGGCNYGESADTKPEKVKEAEKVEVEA